MTKNLFLGFLFVTVALFLTSCQNEEEKTGKDYKTEIANNFNNEVLNEFILEAKDNDRLFVKAANSNEEAWRDCATWIYTDQQGGTATFMLPDNMGSVKAVEVTDEEGAYINVYFDLEGNEEFVLKYLHPNYINEDNFIPRPVHKGPVAL